ncbi:MAG: hypothetical protein HC898_09065 [Phycisphaerales bacterium]|nr:hypothetical protein [Phycisphaerales bacterium]
MFRLDDTIIAVSSPPGRSPRGLVRMSGPACHSIVQELTGEPLPTVRHVVYRVVQLKATHGQQRLPLPVLLACWHGPHSYTGQNVVEIQCPGHPALLERLLHQVTGLGARLAGPGEFTFRAFMHGKMDLTQAEGVAALISATGQAELTAARHLCEGELGHWSQSLAQKLADLLALVEAGIDFTDQEDVVLITPGKQARVTIA